MNGIDRLAEEIRKRTNENKSLGNITIAEVTAYSEQSKTITLKMFGMLFSKNISIAEHLLKGYERSFDVREFNFKGTLKSLETATITNFQLSTSLPASPGVFAIPYTPSSAAPVAINLGPALQTTGTLELENGDYEITDTTGEGIITWNKDSLIVGDKVKVHISWDQEHFYVLDRFEAFGGG